MKKGKKKILTFENFAFSNSEFEYGVSVTGGVELFSA